MRTSSSVSYSLLCTADHIDMLIKLVNSCCHWLHCIAPNRSIFLSGFIISELVAPSLSPSQSIAAVAAVDLPANDDGCLMSVIAVAAVAATSGQLSDLSSNSSTSRWI